MRFRAKPAQQKAREESFELKILRAAVRRGLVYYPDLGVVYLANAKAGTSTVRSTLWGAVDAKLGVQTRTTNPRRQVDSPALGITNGTLKGHDVDEIMDAVFFSVVRHPLVRLVSGYLDKILSDPTAGIWKLVANRYNLPLDKPLAFPDFVDHITADKPHLVNRHFWPQSNNIAYGYAPHRHIGQLEDLERTALFLEQYGVPKIETFKRHATSAADSLKTYYSDPGVLKKVIAYYEADFERFNYAPGIDNILPLGPITPPKADTATLRDVLSTALERLANKPVDDSSSDDDEADD
jgi:hypothetical protein